MTAPEVFQVHDGGWEVYIPNASGGWRLVSHLGGTAVVHTLPDRAEVMVAFLDVTQCGDCGRPVVWEADFDRSLWTACDGCGAYASTSRGGDRRG